MVEKITINPSKIRAYGNIIDDKSVEDFERYESSLVGTTVTINGVSIPAYLLLYSPNNFVFDFDGNLKHLYVSEDEDTVEAFTFDSSNKRLAFSSDDVAFGFDDDNKRLYCDNDYHPTTYLVSLAVSSNTVNIGGSVTLTATVTDDEETVVEGATVTFKVGGSTIDTSTTNSSGVATLSYTCNTTGTLSFSASCNGANSTSQSVTVNKLSTSTALTTSSASVTVGTSVTFTATVTSGGSGVNGLTVTFKDGTSTLGTGTTNSSGVATYTTNSLSVATHSITAVVTETGTYATSTSSAVSVVVSESVSVASVALTGTSNILSNYHNETCTLTATVLDTNNQAVSGETVTFYNGSTSMGTATTNASGVATKTYSSTGAGDVSFTAECSSVTSSAYTVEDCLWFDAAVTGNTHSSDYSNFGSAPTLTVTTDGMKVSSSNGERWATIPILLTTDDDFELTYTYNGGASNVNCAEISSASNQRHTTFYVGLDDNRWHYDKNNTGMQTFYRGAITVGDKIKITRVNGVYTYYQNDTIRLNNLSNNSGGYVAFETYQDGRYTIYKDIKLKAI